MKLVKKLKLNINKDCKEYLDFASEQCRLLYNFTLAQYRDTDVKYEGIYKEKKTLPELKKRFPNYAKVYNKCLSATLFRLDNAFQRFFNPKLESGFPKYKGKHIFVSQEYPAMYIKQLDDYRFKLPMPKGQKPFVIRACEPIPQDFKTVTITKQKDTYFACFIYEIDELKQKDNGEILTLDLGIKSLAKGYSSKQEFMEIPKFSHYTRHLDKLQSKKARCKKGSRRKKKWAKILDRQRTRYQNRVNDYMHKATHNIMAKRSESTIVVGQLNLDGMIKENQPWFNRILQNEWRVGRFVGFLDYKSQLYGKRLVKIDESYTTKTCSNCGYVQEMSLKDRVYCCPGCGLELDRDYNSSINIMKRYCVAYTVDVNSDINVLVLARNLKPQVFKYI